MRRGDIVVTALPRDYKKPRPAIVVQSDRLSGTESILLCPCTSDPVPPHAIRVSIEPSAENGLRIRSQIMVENITAIPRSRCSEVIGRLDAETVDRLNEALALVIGLAD